jgi:hypothetical protein
VKVKISPSRSLERIQRVIARQRNDARIRAIARQVASSVSLDENAHPVVLFNASTRLSALSLNAGFQLLTGWALHLAGVPVIHFACHRGLTRCIHGTDKDNPSRLPPCAECVWQTRVNTLAAETRRLVPVDDTDLRRELEGLDLAGLIDYQRNGIPLGQLVLPSLRWVLRRHNLVNDVTTLYILREFLLSANRVAEQFNKLLDDANPRAVVVFNGQFFPEATARWAAQKRGLPVISHEVGLMPFTGYFTPGEATAYPIDIPVGYELSAKQNERLDAYLSKRFTGDFSMAGIRFWSGMQELDAGFLEKAAGFKQIVPIFTNVIFDTSQGHANVLFHDMFTWLDELLSVIKHHPETLFVIRAHPDEKRPGKESRETVADWVRRSGCLDLPNVQFVGAEETFSSYELIRRSKFVLCYNSTIGLEASIMGAPVLCGGKARFTQVPSVFFPATAQEYLHMMEDFLQADKVEALPEHRLNARIFLYFQLFRSSLPFDNFLDEDHFWKGYVTLKDFRVGDLRRKESVTIDTILHGILEGGDFLLPE